MRRTCINMVHSLASRDPRVLFLGSDLSAGVLDGMKVEMPDRFFMEGICEQNLIGMAAGLAMEGYIPYVNTIATFLTRRCYEQVALDVCLHNLPVRLIGNGGGLVYAPLGPTHMAIEDIAIMRALPNMAVFCAADADEMVRFMEASLDYPGPIYIRLAKGGDPVVSRKDDGFEIGRGIFLREGRDVALIATGIMVNRALATAALLAIEGITCTVLNLHTVKPLDEQAVLKAAGEVRLVVTLEEHVATGGLGSAVTDRLTDHPPHPFPAIKRLALPDSFTEGYGSQDEQLEKAHLQPPQLAETVRAAYLAHGRN